MTRSPTTGAPQESLTEPALIESARELASSLAEDLHDLSSKKLGQPRQDRLQRRIRGSREGLVELVGRDLETPETEGGGFVSQLRALGLCPDAIAILFFLNAVALIEEGAGPKKARKEPSIMPFDPHCFPPMEAAPSGAMDKADLLALFDLPRDAFYDRPSVKKGFLMVFPGDPDLPSFAGSLELGRKGPKRGRRKDTRSWEPRFMVCVDPLVRDVFAGALPDPGTLRPALPVRASAHQPGLVLDPGDIGAIAEAIQRQIRRRKNLARWSSRPAALDPADFTLIVESASPQVGHAAVLAAAAKLGLDLDQVPTLESLDDDGEPYRPSDGPAGVRSLFRQAKLRGHFLYVRDAKGPKDELLGRNRFPLPPGFEFPGDDEVDALTLAGEFDVGLILGVTDRKLLPDALGKDVPVVRCGPPSTESVANFLQALVPTEVPGQDAVDWPRVAQANPCLETLERGVRRALSRAAEEARPLLATEGILEAIDALPPAGPSRSDKDTVPPTRLADVHVAPAVRAQLDDILAALRVRQRKDPRLAEVFARYRQSQGLVAQFHGPSGTGKTLATYALAGEADLPHRVISVAAMESCYIGASEKNLVKILEEAERDGVVLLLDEADSLLMSRDLSMRGNGRYASSVVNTFLRALETFSGILFMTTNRRVVMDRAIARRITWQVGFPAPGARERESIWRSHLPQGTYQEPVDFANLGRSWSLHGGHIKAACMRAHLRAATAERLVSREDLEMAAREQSDADFDTPRDPAGFGP